MIRASAPGKVVLWGEYAVLTGAPALVMAVERRARCVLDAGGGEWQFTAPGLSGETVAEAEGIPRSRLIGAPPPAPEASWALAWHVLHTLDAGDLPLGCRVRLDTVCFQESGRKLGIGSSAALCAALCAAFGRLLGRPVSAATALVAHQAFQGGAGSGIDVAAAWHGGTLRFQRGQEKTADPVVDPWPLPGELRPTFVYAGEPASTPRHLQRFRAWLKRGGGREIDELGCASEALFDASDPLAALTRYVEALSAFDRAADLGIFGAGHRRLQRLAFDAGVVYKPCGAGGGDIGAAFTPDTAAASRFARLAADNGFLPLALETASHGIEVTG